MGMIKLKNIVTEGGYFGSEIYYHGSTDKNFGGKAGIHVGTKEAATEALEARIASSSSR